MYCRSYTEVLAMFEGLELVEPGVVSAPQWRPEPGCYDVGATDVSVCGSGPLGLTFFRTLLRSS